MEIEVSLIEKPAVTQHIMGLNIVVMYVYQV